MYKVSYHSTYPFRVCFKKAHKKTSPPTFNYKNQSLSAVVSVHFFKVHKAHSENAKDINVLGTYKKAYYNNTHAFVFVLTDLT